MAHKAVLSLAENRGVRIRRGFDVAAVEPTPQGLVVSAGGDSVEAEGAPMVAGEDGGVT